MMMGISAYLPAYVQGGMGYSALIGGLVLGAMSVSWAGASLFGARIMVRTSYRLVAVWGAIAMVAGCAILILTAAGRRSSIHRGWLAHRWDRHGVLHQRLCRLSPGFGALEPTGRGDLLDNVPPLHGSGGRGERLQCGTERDDPSDGCGRRPRDGSHAGSGQPSRACRRRRSRT